MTEILKLKDVVKPISGGKKMVVIAINGDNVTCLLQTKSGKKSEEIYNLNALKKIKPFKGWN